LDLTKLKEIIYGDLKKLRSMMGILRGTPKTSPINTITYGYEEDNDFYFVEIELCLYEPIIYGAELNLLLAMACVMNRHCEFKVFTAVEAVEGKLIFRYTFEDPEYP